MSDSKHVTYEDAGVDTAEGGRAVDAIKQMVKDTNRPEVIGGIGFGKPDHRIGHQHTVGENADGLTPGLGVGSKKTLFVVFAHIEIRVGQSCNDRIAQGAPRRKVVERQDAGAQFRKIRESGIGRQSGGQEWYRRRQTRDSIGKAASLHDNPRIAKPYSATCTPQEKAISHE